MKTNRGYIVAMHKPTNKIVTVSLEMWDLIENRGDYKPLYRADDKKDADNYVKEISSTIPKESNMVDKQEFIDKACEVYSKHITKFNPTLKGFPTALDDIVNTFRKQLEE